MEAAADILGGNAKADEFKTEAQLAERQARDTDLQSVQMSEQRRENLRASLATIDTLRVQSGLDPDSPTGMAIDKEIRRQSVRDESIDRVGYGNRSSALRLQGAAYRRGAKAARLTGYIRGVSSLAKSAASAADAAG